MPKLLKRRLKCKSLDTETTGLDRAFIARPFLVTVCRDDGTQVYWEWSVDPVTRMPEIPPGDLDEIRREIADCDRLYFHGVKYDGGMLKTVGVLIPWDRAFCTLTCCHLLASNYPRNLTDAYQQYLGHLPGFRSIAPLEEEVRRCTVAARALVRQAFPDWRLAEEGDPDMPSVSGSNERDEDKPWKNDLWVMRAVIAAFESVGQPWRDDPEMVRWDTATADYANGDSAATLALGTHMEAEVERRGYTALFAERMLLPRIALGMEDRGATASGAQTAAQVAEYSAEVDLAQAQCMAIAEQFEFDLQLPAGAAPNDSIREFIWGSTRLECPRCGLERLHKRWTEGALNGQVICPRCLKRKKNPAKIICEVKENPCLALPYQYNDEGRPTLNKDAMEFYQLSLDPGPALDFVSGLAGMRGRQTAVSYMEAYRRFWRPVFSPEELEYADAMGAPDARDYDDWYRLHFNFNLVGTSTLRWSSNSPNGQNISKKENFNLRRCFGPMPGREWWSMDFKNIELRIPAYESGEPAMVELFERPDDAPYFGSYHLLNASIVYPEEFWPIAQQEGEFKRRYKDTLYQWVKNLGFALQYGCGERKADATAHKRGAYRLLKEKLPRVAALNDYWIQRARRDGFVTTIPDTTVSPHGYPLMCTRPGSDEVSPTLPFCYHVSGTAMQCTNRAMVKTDALLRQWQAEGWDGFLTLQIHDELVFDMPAGTGAEPWRTNLDRARALQAAMETAGDGIGIPTPVSVEYHAVSWAKGMAV